VVDERLGPLIRQVWEPADEESGAALELVRGVLVRWLDVTGKAPWLPSLWLRDIVQERGLLRERMLRHIPRDRIGVFRRSMAQAQAMGHINPQNVPDLLFISILAVVMVPQATARIWRRVNPDAAIDRSELERHVMALMMHGLAGARLLPAHVIAGIPNQDRGEAERSPERTRRTLFRPSQTVWTCGHWTVRFAAVKKRLQH